MCDHDNVLFCQCSNRLLTQIVRSKVNPCAEIVKVYILNILLYRTPPQDEQDAVVDYLNKVYRCDLASLPRPAFLHEFAFGDDMMASSAEKYRNCSRYIVNNSKCRRQIGRVCGRSFMDIRFLQTMKMCKRVLWFNDYGSLGVYTRRGTNFKKYDVCVRNESGLVMKCVPELENSCRTSHIRAVKTVRATMDEVEPLLKADPNFRLIHLYRDPRAVYRSRQAVGRWAYSMFEWMDKVPRRRALVYCQTLMRDYTIRKELEKKYPGRIKSLVYEDILMNPGKTKREAYQFLGLSVPKIQPNKRKSRLAGGGLGVPINITCQKWEKQLQPAAVKEIEKICMEFSELVGVKWRR